MLISVFYADIVKDTACIFSLWDLLKNVLSCTSNGNLKRD